MLTYNRLENDVFILHLLKVCTVHGSIGHSGLRCAELFEISVDLLSRCQYCVCAESIQAPASPILSQAHPSVCGKTSHSASLAQSQCRSSG